MSNEIILTTKEELRSIIKSAIMDVLPSATTQQQPVKDAELISQSDACKLLGITNATIISWKKQGKVKYKKLGGRVFFNKTELVNIG